MNCHLPFKRLRLLLYVFLIRLRLLPQCQKRYLFQYSCSQGLLVSNYLQIQIPSVCFLSVFSCCVFSLCFLLSVFFFSSLCFQYVLSVCVFCRCFLSGFAFYRTTKKDTFLSINFDIILLWSGLVGQLLFANTNTLCVFSVCVFCLCFHAVFSLCVFSSVFSPLCVFFSSLFSVCVIRLCFLSVFLIRIRLLPHYQKRYLSKYKL